VLSTPNDSANLSLERGEKAFVAWAVSEGLSENRAQQHYTAALRFDRWALTKFGRGLPFTNAEELNAHLKSSYPDPLDRRDARLGLFVYFEFLVSQGLASDNTAVEEACLGRV
jgi:hypothetical protein